MERKEIISNFIKEICRQEDVLGIIFYGSSSYKMEILGADIDLLFITSDDKNYKGTTYIEGIKVEYFLKNIYYLMERIELLPLSFDRSLISIFQNGQVLYSKNKTVEYLKEEILSIAKSFPSKGKNKKCYESDFIDFYEQIQFLNFNDESYSYIYYNLIESVRKRYHEEHGFSKLPSMKIYSLYTNSDYAEEFYCVKLPDQHFRDCYLEMVASLKEKEEITKFMKFLTDSVNWNKRDNYSKKYYSKVELKYLSTIVRNMIDKTVYYLKTNHPFASSCYYVTLEKIRRLYCYMNKLEDKFLLDNEEYDIHFLELFHLCISHSNHSEYLEQLFCYVVESLQMDYKNYKILELSY